MRRIMIIGGPGAGKSWLAEALARRTGLPVVAVDRLVWRDDGVLQPADAIDAAVRAAALEDRWIIEGGNSRTYADRAARADNVIVLRPPRWLRLWRIFRRERCSLQLLKWTWRYDAVFGPKDAAIITLPPSGTKVHVLTSSRAVRAFLDSFAASTGA